MSADSYHCDKCGEECWPEACCKGCGAMFCSCNPVASEELLMCAGCYDWISIEEGE